MRKGIVLLVLLGVLVLAGKLKAKEEKWKSRSIAVKATAYCPCQLCTDGDGLTATQRSAWKAGVAVDPSVIPLGAYLDIPGYGRGPNNNGSWIKADDTGGKIKGEKIDVRFDGHQEALDWAGKKGYREITIRVWERDNSE